MEKRFNIFWIGFFGSYLINIFYNESDIDLIYDFKEGIRLGFKESYELEEYIKELLEVEMIDLVNYEYVNLIIEDEIDKMVIYVWEEEFYIYNDDFWVNWEDIFIYWIFWRFRLFFWGKWINEF